VSHENAAQGADSSRRKTPARGFAASSRDGSGRYGTEEKFAGGVGDHFAGGEWRVDASHNQIVAVTNSGQKTRRCPADAAL
jgi:hypothetical protein